MAYGYYNLFTGLYSTRAGALKPRLQHIISGQECISYKIMMKNDHFYWGKMDWATTSYSGSHTLFVRSFNKSFMFLFLMSSPGVIINYPKTIVLTSALQVILFYHQVHNGISILSCFILTQLLIQHF